MPRSRTPRRRLTAVVLMVLGVLAVALFGPLPSAPPAEPVSAAASATSAVSVAATAPAGEASAPVFSSGASTPGCRQGGAHHGSDPAAPVRARTAHDQAPVLEDRLAPVALCGLYAAHRNPPVRGPTLGAPTPVELSVLRV
ncbi:hypothetical protein [Streptomyces hundungensis]|uniref:hypothetical protein n=1 Tax=Streptomyces hundungensis TaxID=1077946 RepID=UPI0033FC2D83